MIHEQSEDSTTIAIVGCGASGAVTLYHLIEYYAQLNLHHPVQICIFEKNTTLGVGVAYGTDNEEHILNMRNGTIDIFSDKPGHFMDWLKLNAANLGLTHKDIGFDAFLPRKIVGLYLQESLERSLQRAKQLGIVVDFIHEDVDDFQEINTKQRLRYKNAFLDADYTVFCLGNLPSTHYPELYDVPTYFHTPWELDDTIRFSTQPVGILGASLTAIDALITLAPTATGLLYCIAPNGRLPKVLHIKKPFTPLFVTEKNIRSMTSNFTRKLRLSEVIELFRREIEAAVGSVDWGDIWRINDDPLKELEHDIARAEKGKNHWHTVLADTSLLLPLIWDNLRLADRKTFYREYYSWWRVYRVSMPLQNAKKVRRLLKTGRLKIVRNLKSVQYNADTKLFTIFYNDRHRNKAILQVSYLIDATGTGFDITKSRSRLVQNMIRSGSLSPHSLGGVRVNPKTLRLVKQDGQELPRTFFFGMLTKGAHFYTNALDANAVHAEKVSKIIIRDVRKTIARR